MTKENPQAEKHDLSRYPRPSVTVDVVIFTIMADDLRVLLVQRKAEPFRGVWAIPGGFVHIDEDLLAAARRELEEETGLRGVYLEQLYTFGEPDRDPRSRVITVTYFALVSTDLLRGQQLRATTDAQAVQWFSMYDLPDLAFDHARILDYALTRLRGKLDYTNIVSELLPEEFSLSELQRYHEIILHRPLDKRNFRKKMEPRYARDGSPLANDPSPLLETGKKRMIGTHRPARLFRYKDKSRVD